MNVLDWLLDSDPAIRWQVLRDLVHASVEVVAAECEGGHRGLGCQTVGVAGRRRHVGGRRVLSGKVHCTLEDGGGRPSRWNTLRALRVLNWYERPLPEPQSSYRESTRHRM